MRDFSTRPRPARPSLADALLLVAAAVAFVGSGAAAFAARRDYREKTDHVSAARRALDESRARVQALESQPVDQALARQTLLTLEASPPRVLAALATLLPPDVRLDGVDLRYGERLELEVRVIARTSESYDLFLDRLQSSPLFADVLPGEENRDGEVRASLRASYRGNAS